MEPTVSIIVPVYNAENTISRCIESILNQEYSDFELLLVNDGSADSSGAICDEYAARDARVRVIHKENTGVSDTRNTALSQARGTYLQFLDSDDWITPDATSSLVRAAESGQCDLVVSDFYRVVGERVSQKGDIDDDSVMTREEYAAHMMENPADFYYGVLWNKLYRRSIVEAHHLRMDPEISWCEDFMFNLEYIRYAETFRALQVPIYYYVKTKGSLANQSLTISKTVKMKLTVFEYYQRFFKSVLDDEEYEKSRLKVYRFLLDAAGDGSVPPPMLPNSRKLGNERMQVSPDALSGEGVLYDAFRERKLLERYVETAALKNDLSLREAKLLLALRDLAFQPTRRELADFVNMSRGTLSLSLQKLASRGLVKLTEVRRNTERFKRLDIAFSEGAQPILADLETARQDYETSRLASLTPEELEQHDLLAAKIQAHIRDVLQ
ncbi:glycosyltransferase [Oscillibacter sp.]|uniref:glycosyltransferase n=1 Tax=Oscillibacter sp. TaxID=1945593 RepID=UPI001B4B6316|nr:glycosyltransferase [Oscillibacter sp.]MBP3508822.1 glycosyltransferase [Oscillibacter sp.]